MVLQSCTEPVEWQFLQCFGERTPGEEVQEGKQVERVNNELRVFRLWKAAVEADHISAVDKQQIRRASQASDFVRRQSAKAVAMLAGSWGSYRRSILQRSKVAGLW